MKCLKRTSLNCGLMNIPVAVYKATDAESVLDRAGPSGRPIYRKEFDSGTDEEIVNEEVLYGIKTGDTFLPINTEVIEKIKERAIIDGIEIQDYVDYGEIDLKRIKGGYYLAALDNLQGMKALCLALLDSDKVAVAKWTNRSRQYLVNIWPEDDGSMIMNTVCFAEQWREPDESCLSHMGVDIDATLVEKAKELIEVTGHPYDLMNTAVDDYVTDTRELILNATVQGTPIVFNDEEELRTTDSDKILEALEASISAAKP